MNHFGARTCVAGGAALAQHMLNVEGKAMEFTDIDLFIEVDDVDYHQGKLRRWLMTFNALFDFKLHCSEFMSKLKMSRNFYVKGRLEFVANIQIFWGSTFRNKEKLHPVTLQIVGQRKSKEPPIDFGHSVLSGFDLTCVQFSIDDFKKPCEVRPYNEDTTLMFDRRQMVYDNRKYTNPTMFMKRVTKYQERGFDLVGIDVAPHLCLTFENCAASNLITGKTVNGSRHVERCYDRIRRDPMAFLKSLGYKEIRPKRKANAYEKKEVSFAEVVSAGTGSALTRSRFKKIRATDNLGSLPKTVVPLTRCGLRKASLMTKVAVTVKTV